MRVFLTLLVVFATLFATSEASDVAASQAISGFQTQNNGQRFLRKRAIDEIDESDSEERAFDAKALGDTVKGFFSKNQRLMNLLKANTADDVLLSKNVNPTSLKNAVKNFKNKLSPADYEKFKQMANKYNDYWYRNGPF